MISKITGLTRYCKKGEPGEILFEAKLVEGIGMESGRHMGGDRQISLLSAETRDWMDSQADPGLCFGKFRENIRVDGIVLNDVTDGSRLSVGEAVLRVNMGKKHCYDECGLLSKGSECRLSGGAVFAAVERGGVVRIGDFVSLCG